MARKTSPKSTPAKPADSVSLALLVQRWEMLRLRGKKAYSEAGQLMAQIAARMSAGESCQLADGRSPRLIDKASPEFWKGKTYVREESYLTRYDLSVD
jgi:hypothetical protein